MNKFIVFIFHIFKAKSEVVINHFKIYGSCYCSNGVTTKCVVASEDDITKNDGKQRVLLCSADVQQLPSCMLFNFQFNTILSV